MMPHQIPGFLSAEASSLQEPDTSECDRCHERVPSVETRVTYKWEVMCESCHNDYTSQPEVE
jgi:formylmethanofuran dehydrogenase subunit E